MVSMVNLMMTPVLLWLISWLSLLLLLWQNSWLDLWLVLHVVWEVLDLHLPRAELVQLVPSLEQEQFCLGEMVQTISSISCSSL